MTMYDIVSLFLICWLVFVRRKKLDSSNFGLTKTIAKLEPRVAGLGILRRQYFYLAG